MQGARRATGGDNGASRATPCSAGTRARVSRRGGGAPMEAPAGKLCLGWATPPGADGPRSPAGHRGVVLAAVDQAVEPPEVVVDEPHELPVRVVEPAPDIDRLELHRVRDR